MVIVWRLRGNIIRTVQCWVVWHNVHSQQHTHVSSSYRSSRLGLSHWDPYTMHRGGCLSCIIVTWWSGPGGIKALSERPTSFLQCFDTVGLVIWPVKVVLNMTYNVFGGTLNVAQSMLQNYMVCKILCMVYLISLLLSDCNRWIFYTCTHLQRASAAVPVMWHSLYRDIFNIIFAVCFSCSDFWMFLGLYLSTIF